jgi:hypothetical protein
LPRLAALGKLFGSWTPVSLDPGNHWALRFQVYVLVEMGRAKEAAALFKRMEGAGTSRIIDFDPYVEVRVSVAADDDRDVRSSLKAIMPSFADRATSWDILQNESVTSP